MDLDQLTGVQRLVYRLGKLRCKAGFTNLQNWIHVLKNCLDDGKILAQTLAERTRSQVVQVIGRMIVLYKPAKEEKDRKIVLP